MASVRFEKGSEEWMMFQDFWKLCQKFWQVESSDEYWEDLVKKIDEFCKKYKEIQLSKEIAFAFVNAQEHKYKI